MSMDTASSDRVVIFGGLGLSSRERLNEIWVYNMKGMQYQDDDFYSFQATICNHKDKNAHILRVNQTKLGRRLSAMEMYLPRDIAVP